MMVWDEKNSDIGYWGLQIGGENVVWVREEDEGQFRAVCTLGQHTIGSLFENKTIEEVKVEVADWYGKLLEGEICLLEAQAAKYREQLEMLRETPLEKQEEAPEPLVNISDLSYDGDGYLHFVVEADGYALEGLYRLYDPDNGKDMTLVSIDYGYLHPIIERQWDRIEAALYDICLDMYHGILDKSEAFKEKVVVAMKAVGYTYDALESHEGWETFYGEGGVRLGFDRLHEAAEWLEGVVFDDANIARKVEEILHPERVQEKRLSDVLVDATIRATEGDGKKVEEVEQGLF